MLWSKRERHPPRSPLSPSHRSSPSSPNPTTAPDPQHPLASSSVNLSSGQLSSTASSSSLSFAPTPPDSSNIDLERRILSPRSIASDQIQASNFQDQHTSPFEDGPYPSALPVYPPHPHSSLPSIVFRPNSAHSSPASSTLIGTPEGQTRPSTPPQVGPEDEIYLGLSTFTFGAARSSVPSPHFSPFEPGARHDTQISPLTPILSPSNIDRTPRPSMFVPHDSPHDGDHPPLRPGIHPVSAPAPASSLPSPQRRTRGPTTPEDHVSDSDDVRPEALYSDTASQHTFGVHGVNSSSTSLSSLDNLSHSQTGFSSDEEGALLRYGPFGMDLIPEPSPVTFASADFLDDEEDEGNKLAPLPKDPFHRRRSLPMAIPGASTSTEKTDVLGGGDGRRDREPSLATLRRPSRSLDDDLRTFDLNLGVGGASEPSTRGDWASLEARNDDGQAAYQNAGMNIGYILGGQDAALSRRESDALSFAQPVRRSSQASQALAFGWEWHGPPRRASTTTVGTGMDDTFARHLRGWDEEYGTQKGFWSFRREKADGSSPRGLKSGSGLNTKFLSPSASFRESKKGKEDGRVRIKEREKEREKEKEKEKEKEASALGMAPGTQEIWMCEFVGRFKVDRNVYRPDATKPPHQRLNIRHILDPYSLGNTRGGPSVTIHKHSRAVAFSIYRAHDLVGHHRLRPGVLLAPKKVQERFTSTKTTAKLATHGLLEDGDGDRDRRTAGRRSGAVRSSSLGRRDREKEKGKKRPEESKPKNKNKDERIYPITAVETDNNAARITFELPEIPKVVTPTPEDRSAQENLLTTASADKGDDQGPQSRRDSLSDESTISSLRHHRRDSWDSDRPTRTPHAETYGALDSSLIEYVRTRSDHHHRSLELDSGTSFFRRLLRPLPRSNLPASGMTAGHTSAQLEGNYKPPWLAMVPRAKQEETDRVIHNLNNSFKGVGLLPANSSLGHKSKKSSSRTKDTGRACILDYIPDDSLFMLLPLWPGETDPLSTGRDAAAPLAPALEERNYLLVHYVAFGKEPERRKKGTRHTQSSSSHDGTRPQDGQDGRGIILTEFHVAARLVGHGQLRGSGVRLPSDGLSVTGPMWEAAQSIPDLTTRLRCHGDVAIAVYHSRDRGIEFLPEGLVKMGLCLPLVRKDPETDLFEMGENAVEDWSTPLLSPVGRAAVEMVWAGCMALSSFGPTPPGE